MKSRLLREIAIIICFFLTTSLYSFCYGNERIRLTGYNQQQISGKVTDEQKNPLVGVTVTIRETNISTITDNNGIYNIIVEKGQTIIFSFVGYDTKEVVFGGKEINVTLELSSTQLGEVVVVGYQTQKKADLTGAVSVVDVNNLKNSTTSNPIKSLQGLVPGLFINTDGNPTGAATVRVRGVSTLNNNDPLYIIDGVPTKSNAFQILNSSDIESIQVLKDASSAAIYGARSSNGVIIVTTKQGNKDRTKITFDTRITQSQFVTVPEVLNTEDRAKVQWQATINDGLNPDNIPHVKYDWVKNPDGTATLRGISIPETLAPGVPSANTDWFDVISRKGLLQEYNLSLSTGSSKGGAFMSLGYLKDMYIAKFKDFKKISARINSYYNLLDGRIKVGENLIVTNGIDDGMASTTPFSESLQLQPILPNKLDNGDYSPY